MIDFLIQYKEKPDMVVVENL